MKPPEYDLSRDEIIYLIQQYIFSRRDRDMIADRLLEGLTYDQLSEKYYMSVRQVQNVIHKSKGIIFGHIDKLNR